MCIYILRLKMTKTDFLKLNMTNAHIYIYIELQEKAHQKKEHQQKREKERVSNERKERLNFIFRFNNLPKCIRLFNSTLTQDVQLFYICT